MSSLMLRNVSKIYPDNVYAVKDLNLEIEDKEFLILVGPSGCGKSTALRMIAGLEEISQGELWLDKNFINYVAPQKRDLSMVFQNYALYPNMTVYENLAFSLKVRKVPKQEIRERVEDVAETLQITPYLKSRPADLSGGQKQRVAIGSAIIRNSKALLMDEPLSNLDAKLRAEMRVMLSQLHEKYENTIIYVTHDQTEAMTLGTRIVVLKDGIVQQVDTPERIYRYPENLFVAGFMGSPPMNFLEADVLALRGEVVLSGGGLCTSLTPALQRRLEYKDYLGKRVMLGIRAEDIVLDDEGMEVPVVAREMLGSEVILYVRVGTGEWRIRVDIEQYHNEETVRIVLKQENILAFDLATEKNILLEGEEKAS